MEYHFATSLQDALDYLKQHESVLVFFSDESCNVGDALSPKLQKLLEEHFDKMNFLEINVQMIPEARGYFNIFVIPSVLVYFDGKETIRQARHVNVQSLAAEIDRVYSLFY